MFLCVWFNRLTHWMLIVFLGVCLCIGFSLSILTVLTSILYWVNHIYLAQQSFAVDHHPSPNRCERGSDTSCQAGQAAASPVPESCPDMGRWNTCRQTDGQAWEAAWIQSNFGLNVFQHMKCLYVKTGLGLGVRGAGAGTYTSYLRVKVR